LRVVGLGLLDDFCGRHADVKEQAQAWLAEVKAAQWSTTMDIKERYPSASFLENNRVVFNLKGNRYRLVTKVSYKNRVVRIMKAGTHADYDRWKL
jgi:mRNA interferase HigB